MFSDDEAIWNSSFSCSSTSSVIISVSSSAERSSRKLPKSIVEVVVDTEVVLIELVVEVGVVELVPEVGSAVLLPAVDALVEVVVAWVEDVVGPWPSVDVIVSVVVVSTISLVSPVATSVCIGVLSITVCSSVTFISSSMSKFWSVDRFFLSTAIHSFLLISAVHASHWAKIRSMILWAKTSTLLSQTALSVDVACNPLKSTVFSFTTFEQVPVCFQIVSPVKRETGPLCNTFCSQVDWIITSPHWCTHDSPKLISSRQSIFSACSMLGRPEQRALLSGYEASSILNLMFQMILPY